jgi:MFS family permease
LLCQRRGAGSGELHLLRHHICIFIGLDVEFTGIRVSGSKFRKEASPLFSISDHNTYATPARRTFYYGWVIVAASAVIMFMHAGIMYSYGVFFKHLIADFGWSRAATSGVHSVFMIFHGGLAIAVGWLVDRTGPARVMASCAFIAGLGLVLTSQITELWQLYITYGLIVGIGESAGFIAVTSTTARWFTRHRGLALGIVSSGVGLGTLIIVPVTERLIAAFGWSMAYLILGLATWVLMVPASLLLRRNPSEKQRLAHGENDSPTSVPATPPKKAGRIPLESGMPARVAARQRPLWMLLSIYFLFNFCLQIVMVHLVNYATDIGTSSFIAATFISIIGAGSLLGRLSMGTASDRIGSINALLICCTILMTTMVWLIFSREVWMFYLFAIVFGFAYGGEVPQMPVLVGRFFGMRALAVLVGMVVFGATIGGAIGAWAAGQVFDITQSYLLAFTIAVAASFTAIIITAMLKKVKPPTQAALY